MRVGKEGLGSDIKTLERLCADDNETLSLIDVATENPNCLHHAVNNVNGMRPEGNSRQTALRSLRKNAPEVHKEVISGKLSAHAGMLKAGLRRIESAIRFARVTLPLLRRQMWNHSVSARA